MEINLSKPVSIVCHDIGAANHIFSWIKANNAADLNNLKECRILLSGPALNAWQEYNYPQIKSCKNIEELLNGANLLIAGTGWSSNLEYDAVKFASKNMIKTISVVDHWTNYRARFIRDNVEVLPDEIWVTDDYARAIARKEFPNINITKIPNFYLDNILDRIDSIQSTKSNLYNILYVLEPVRNAWGEDITNGEFQALDHFISNISIKDFDHELFIKLRPHPSENNDKYDKWIASHDNFNISIDKTSSLESLIAWSSIVVGCQSYAMIVALEAKKKVYTSIPPWAPPCVLPHNNIINISDIKSQN